MTYQKISKTTGKRFIHMTLHIEEDLWRKFSIKVIKEYGGRKNSLVLCNLIKKFLKSTQQSTADESKK